MTAVHARMGPRPVRLNRNDPHRKCRAYGSSVSGLMADFSICNQWISPNHSFTGTVREYDVCKSRSTHRTSTGQRTHENRPCFRYNLRFWAWGQNGPFAARFHLPAAAFLINLCFIGRSYDRPERVARDVAYFSAMIREEPEGSPLASFRRQRATGVRSPEAVQIRKLIVWRLARSGRRFNSTAVHLTCFAVHLFVETSGL
jgi:hypothetical protein